MLKQYVSLKIHFLQPLLDFYPDNLGNITDNHGVCLCKNLGIGANRLVLISLTSFMVPLHIIFYMFSNTFINCWLKWIKILTKEN